MVSIRKKKNKTMIYLNNYAVINTYFSLFLAIIIISFLFSILKDLSFEIFQTKFFRVIIGLYITFFILFSIKKIYIFGSRNMEVNGYERLVIDDDYIILEEEKILKEIIIDFRIIKIREHRTDWCILVAVLKDKQEKELLKTIEETDIFIVKNYLAKEVRNEKI